MNKESASGHSQNQPLISVVIPVYNVADYMDQCMKTVCAQTYKNLEIIVVDDGSTDASSELCDKWAIADSRIRLIRQHNQGLSAARNAGIDIATGEWIGFVDSDDWIELDMYENLYSLAVAHDADIVACSHVREKRHTSKARYTSGEITVITPEEALKMLVIDTRLQNHAWSKLYRRKMFDTVRFPVGAVYEDIAVSHLLMHQANRVVLIDKPYYHYRILRKSLSRVPQINANKECQYFRHITQQIDFVHNKVGWWKPMGFYLHRRGVRCIGHLLLLPKSVETDKRIDEIVATMHRYKFCYTVKFTPIVFIKRFWILRHLRSYRCAYRFIEHIKLKPRFAR